jgi:hypothetical protein
MLELRHKVSVQVPKSGTRAERRLVRNVAERGVGFRLDFPRELTSGANWTRSHLLITSCCQRLASKSFIVLMHPYYAFKRFAQQKALVCSSTTLPDR